VSNTRHAETGSPLRQERWASSAENERGLLANLVAKRCASLERAEDRELVWFLQHRSWQKGGLGAVAQAVIREYPDAWGTVSMRAFGVEPFKVYSGQEVRKVRAKIPEARDRFLLRGEFSRLEEATIEYVRGINWDALYTQEDAQRARIASQARPESYPASAFLEYCLAAGGGLEEHLIDLCLNPKMDLAGDANPWYCAGLIETLRLFMAESAKQDLEETVVTGVGVEIFDCFERAASTRMSYACMGREGTGKTFSARKFCELYPGRARYVEVPPGSDEKNLLRDIAEAFGLSKNNNVKKQDLSVRVREVAETGDLVLCLDEAHRLWNTTTRNFGLPGRVELVMTLVNAGVPVLLISTPQCLNAQETVKARTNWNMGQWERRFQFRSLTERLSKEDLYKIASAVLPELDETTWRGLAAYAGQSAEHAGVAKTVRDTAHYLASKEGRENVTVQDVRAALAEKLALDYAMQSALDVARAAVKGRRRPSLAPGSPEPGEMPAERSRSHGETVLRPIGAGGRAVRTGPLQDRIAPATELVA
jgi:hypothetical protein